MGAICARQRGNQGDDDKGGEPEPWKPAGGRAGGRRWRLRRKRCCDRRNGDGVSSRNVGKGCCVASFGQMNELCSVPSGGNDDAHRVGHAFAGFVDFLQALAQGVKRHANDGIGLGIEVWPSPQGFDRDGVLLDLVAASGGSLFADVTQYLRQVRRATESSGFQQPVELCTLREFQIGRCRRRSHGVIQDSRSRGRS